MHRRPPSSAPSEAPLLEKFPHLEAEWKSGLGGDRSELLDIYEQLSTYTGANPIDWNKPEGFLRAERACGEIVATTSLMHKLSTMAADYSYDYDAARDDSHRNALLHQLGALNTFMVSAQTSMETVEAIAEYRWLQANVNGDFSAMPKEWRKRYTNTSSLLSDHRFEHIKQRVDDPEAMARLEENLTTAFQYISEAVGELEHYMNDAGPLYGLQSREARMLAVTDHNTCLHELIPHMRDQLAVAQSEIKTLVNHATLDMATRRKGGVGPDVSKVDYLKTDFRKPEDAPATDQPNPNNVTDISEAFRIRAKNHLKDK